MEIKFGTLDKLKQSDGDHKHIYKKNISGSQTMSKVMFNNMKKDIDVLSTLSKNHMSEVLLMVVGESMTNMHQATNLLDCQKYCRDRKVKFILVIASDWRDEISYLQDIENLYDVDLQLMTYFYYKQIYNQTTNNNLNFEQKKILFLTGKPYKPNRLGILKQIFETGQKNLFQFSAWLPQHLNQTIRDITGYDEDQYQKFQKEMHRPGIDSIEVDKNKNITNFHYLGIPYDPQIYSQTCCSLVSETWWHSPKHITEKTWRAIDNLHPFIIAGSPGTTDFLESKGFYTFKDIVTYPQYDQYERYHNSSTQHLDKWIDMMLTNCYDIIESCRQDDIIEMCFKNKKHLKTIEEINYEKIKKFYSGDPKLLFAGIDPNK